jgi:hypothetical protein
VPGDPPPAGSPYPPLPVKPRRTNKVILSVFGGVLGLVLLICVIGAVASGGDDGNESTSNAADTTTTQPAARTTGASQPAAEPSPEPEKSTAAPTKKAAPPPAPTWKTVVTLKGSANKRSATFHLNGGQTRLTYAVKGGDFATVAIYVMEKGTSLEKDGGFPEVMPDGAGKDTTELAKDEGDYYLDVQAANCTWTVTIQERR